MCIRDRCIADVNIDSNVDVLDIVSIVQTILGSRPQEATSASFTKKNEFIVYIGSHGDKGAEIADIILPGAAYTEKNGLFVNLEGKLQTAYKASYPPGDAREDWLILKDIANIMKRPLDFKNIKHLRENIINHIESKKNIISVINCGKNITSWAKFKNGLIDPTEIGIEEVNNFDGENYCGETKGYKENPRCYQKILKSADLLIEKVGFNNPEDILPIYSKKPSISKPKQAYKIFEDKGE